jgi:hypothetical protein
MGIVEHLIPDIANTEMAKMSLQGRVEVTEAIKAKGMGFLGIVTGFWYKWSMSFVEGYGFNFKRKELVLFDESLTKICTTTWPQQGRGVAALLSLPIRSEGGDAKGCLEWFRNQYVCLNSFLVNQMDMFESVLRINGDRRENRKITKEFEAEIFGWYSRAGSKKSFGFRQDDVYPRVLS